MIHIFHSCNFNNGINRKFNFYAFIKDIIYGKYGKNIQKYSKKITESIPEDIDALKGDLKQNIQAAIEAQIKKLDLVTREEFEIQELILKRTREKLEKLEKDIKS